jgi:thioesterase domain-containing protein
MSRIPAHSAVLIRLDSPAGFHEIFSAQRELMGAVQPSTVNRPTVENLKEIWEKVFRRSSIRVTENFYDLGGNAEHADAICAAIAETHSLSVPGAAITHAPTVIELARLLQHDPLPRLSPLVKIKSGSEEHPIFFAHGLSGMVEYHILAQHIRTDYAIYGIQALGLDGCEEAFESIPDMATYYLDALLQKQPVGPYFLIGYSFGGLVALEMSQQLLARKQNVAMLALIDAYPHPRFMRLAQRLQVFVKRIRTHAENISEMPTESGFKYLVKGVKRRLRLEAPLETPRYLDRADISLAATVPWVKQKCYRAYARYRPKFYSGPVDFVSTKVQTFFPGSPTSVWSHLVGDLRIKKIPGDHLSILSTEYMPLAQALTEFIQSARTI